MLNSIPENQKDFNSINNTLKRSKEKVNNSLLNNVELWVNKLKDHIREVEKSKHENVKSLYNSLDNDL